MQAPRLPELPTDADLLDILLKTPGGFGLGDEEIAALRALRFRISSIVTAWFELGEEVADPSFPATTIERLLERVAPAPNSPNRAAFLKIVQQHGAPTPTRSSGT